MTMRRTDPLAEITVPITVHLPGSVYRPLYKFAQARNTEVGTLLAYLAAKAILPKYPRKNVRMNDQLLATMCELLDSGHSLTEIANQLGVSLSNVSVHAKRLRPNHPRRKHRS